MSGTGESVSNGKTLSEGHPYKSAAVDYRRRRSRHLNGEQMLLDQGDSIDDFKRNTG